jgi:Xaa-Pro dipeptidase
MTLLPARVQAPLLNADVLARLRSSGGVRIEDDVIVTAHGVEQMTDVPRDPDEIERFMAQAPAAGQA